MNAANLQVGPQDLASPSRLPGKVSKHQRPRPPGLAVPSSWNPPGQRGSGGPSAGPLARQRHQASLASSTGGTVPAPTTASPCPAPAQHPSPPANTPQDKAPNQCSFLAPSTSPRPCHPGCALSTFIPSSLVLCPTRGSNWARAWRRIRSRLKGGEEGSSSPAPGPALVSAVSPPGPLRSWLRLPHTWSKALLFDFCLQRLQPHPGRRGLPPDEERVPGTWKRGKRNKPWGKASLPGTLQGGVRLVRCCRNNEPAGLDLSKHTDAPVQSEQLPALPVCQAPVQGHPLATITAHKAVLHVPCCGGGS